MAACKDPFDWFIVVKVKELKLVRNTARDGILSDHTEALKVPVLDASVAMARNHCVSFRIELKSGHSLVWHRRAKLLNNSFLEDTPYDDVSILGSCRQPLAIWTELATSHCLIMTSERLDSLLLSEIPQLDCGIATTSHHEM